MKKVAEELFVGTLADCPGNASWAVIHACKSPCHQNVVGYKGSLPNGHPDYLSKTIGDHLYLNLIDPVKPLFQLESFRIFWRFINYQWNESKTILIHCNEGISRAPALAMIFLSKKGLIRPEIENAISDMKQFYPNFCMGTGLRTFLFENWDKL